MRFVKLSTFRLRCHALACTPDLEMTTETSTDALTITSTHGTQTVVGRGALKSALSELAGHVPEQNYLSHCAESWAPGATSLQVTVSRGNVAHTASAKRWHIDVRESALIAGRTVTPCQYYAAQMLAVEV